jgi:hypothetical protein
VGSKEVILGPIGRSIKPGFETSQRDEKKGQQDYGPHPFGMSGHNVLQGLGQQIYPKEIFKLVKRYSKFMGPEL